MAWDVIRFKTRYSTIEDYQVVDIIINGFNIIDILKEIELPFASVEGAPELSGNYEGLPPVYCLPPEKHFWGMPSHPDYMYPGGKVAILENGHSGIPKEWTIICKIEVDGEQVIWKGFEKPQRPSWDYKILKGFHFELVQYRDALRAMSEV